MCCYADDTTFIKSNKDPTKLKQEIDEQYAKLSEYMDKNKLVLNKDKTHLLVMATSKKHKNKNNFDITLNTGSEIIKPQETEFLLGGIISDNLKWNSHIRDHKKSMLNVLTSRINALRKISKIANFKTRKLIANGIFMSKLIYLIQLWGGTSEYLLNFLQKVQNRAARLVTRLGWYTPTETLLTQCGWLSVRQLIVFHSLLQVFKVKRDKLPVFLNEKFSQDLNYNTRLVAGNGIRQNSKITSDLGIKSYSYRSVHHWNTLPLDIRESATLPIFKAKLKKWTRSNIPIK